MLTPEESPVTDDTAKKPLDIWTDRLLAVCLLLFSVSVAFIVCGIFLPGIS